MLGAEQRLHAVPRAHVQRAADGTADREMRKAGRGAVNAGDVIRPRIVRRAIRCDEQVVVGDDPDGRPDLRALRLEQAQPVEQVDARLRQALRGVVPVEGDGEHE